MKTRQQITDILGKEIGTTDNRTSQSNMILLFILEVLVDIRDKN